MEAALAVLLFVVVAGSGFGAWRLASAPRRVLSPEREAMRSALHHASATLPHLREGLDESSAKRAIPHLRALTQAAVLALTDGERVLALGGSSDEDTSDARLSELSAWVQDGRIHVEPGRAGSRTSGPESGVVVAPLAIQDRQIGALIAFYDHEHRLRPDDARVVGEAAALVSAQVELSVVADQEERLTKAELQALRARISPHFVYNSLAAIASYIHSHPDQARDLLAEFAEFTRYSFRRERAYVTLAEELHYVEKYLRLEQARFGERLTIRVEVDPDVLQAVVPVLSLQPLVENAVKHGVESRGGCRTIEIVGIDRDLDVELRVRDDGIGMDDRRAAQAMSGESGGTGLYNVDRRLRSTFGEQYGLAIDSEPDHGTTVVMVVPKFRIGVRAA
ncbi:MAG: histidine kinase [Solirubrobacterales bacterium]|nr:histidine kinase [Solirubrobacterales bacterium]MBV9471550.1 histidine kinase [Solirubrobacterales bacterium]